MDGFRQLLEKNIDPITLKILLYVLCISVVGIVVLWFFVTFYSSINFIFGNKVHKIGGGRFCYEKIIKYKIKQNKKTIEKKTKYRKN